MFCSKVVNGIWKALAKELPELLILMVFFVVTFRTDVEVLEVLTIGIQTALLVHTELVDGLLCTSWLLTIGTSNPNWYLLVSDPLFKTETGNGLMVIVSGLLVETGGGFVSVAGSLTI